MASSTVWACVHVGTWFSATAMPGGTMPEWAAATVPATATPTAANTFVATTDIMVVTQPSGVCEFSLLEQSLTDLAVLSIPLPKLLPRLCTDGRPLLAEGVGNPLPPFP